MSEWRYISASELGTAHISTGQPCQDHRVVKVIPNGRDERLLLVVTSDGAGSAAHSEEGSALVCKQALHWLEWRLSAGDDFLKPEDGLTLIHDLQTQLENYAAEEERGYAVRDLACTINVAALTPIQAWFLQVGDGATIIQGQDRPLEVVFWPDNGEYANHTYFVTDVSDEHIHVRVVEAELDRVAVMTDGIQTLALSLQQRAPHEPFFEPLFKAVDRLDSQDADAQVKLEDGLRRFLNSPRVNAQTNDDKTLVLCSRRVASPISLPQEVT